MKKPEKLSHHTVTAVLVILLEYYSFSLALFNASARFTVTVRGKCHYQLKRKFLLPLLLIRDGRAEMFKLVPHAEGRYIQLMPKKANSMPPVSSKFTVDT